MSKLAKAVIGTVVKLQCPECAEVFDLYWDIAEDIVDAASGEVIPWVCSKCQKKKKGNKEKDPVQVRRKGTRELDEFGNKYAQSVDKGRESTMNDDPEKMCEIVYSSEEMKKDIFEIKSSIMEIKQELEQLRLLVSNRPDG